MKAQEIVQMYMLYRCLLYINVHICDTIAAACAHMWMCMCICMFMHMYMDTYVRLGYCLRRWGVVAEIFYLCMSVHIPAYVYVCACMRVRVNVHMYIYVNMCVCVYVYAYTCTYKREWVYICTRVGFFCLFVLSNLSSTCVYITGVCLTPACVCRRGSEVGGFHV